MGQGTRIKICGITNLDDAKSAVELGADAIGFVFAKSPRRVEQSIVQKISKTLGPFVATVGVFVNEKPAVIQKIARECSLSAVQLHGEENPKELNQIKGVKIIKAFRVEGANDLKNLGRYSANAFLFDTKVSGLHGGTGKVFDWAILKSKTIHVPYIVSGGLNPKNVKNMVKLLSPYGVDVSSGVEKSPGKKDRRLIKEFIASVRKA